MMKFKRWKKMIVMLIVATMFLQSVVVYADDGTLTPVTETKTEAQATANDEPTTVETPGATTLDGMPTEALDTTTPDGTPTEAPGTITSGGTLPGTPSDETAGDLTSETTEKVNGLDEGTDEELLETEPVNEEIPAEVQAFLDAVAAIPEVITPENATEVAEYVYGPVSEAYEALLDTEYMERADVQEAEAAYAAAIEAVDAALNMESETFSGGFLPVKLTFTVRTWQR